MEESLQQEFTNNFFCAQDPVVCLRWATCRHYVPTLLVSHMITRKVNRTIVFEQRQSQRRATGVDELCVVALQDSRRATRRELRRVMGTSDATDITLRESRVNWETHGGRKTCPQNAWWKERSRQACRLCRPTNPIVKELAQPKEWIHFKVRL